MSSQVSKVFARAAAVVVSVATALFVFVPQAQAQSSCWACIYNDPPVASCGDYAIWGWEYCRGTLGGCLTDIECIATFAVSLDGSAISDAPEMLATTSQESGNAKRNPRSEVKEYVQRRACDGAIVARAYTDRIVTKLRKQTTTITL